LLEKLAERLSSQKSKGAKVVVVLSIALILVSVGLLVQLVDIGSLFDPPYPSQDTPLTLAAPDTVLWTNPYNEFYDDHPLDGFFNYSEIAFCFRHEVSSHGSASLGFLANETEQALLSSGTPYTGDLRGIGVVEVAGDGVFGPGDSIVFNSSEVFYPNEFDSETVFTVALMGLGPVNDHGLGEYSYAVHDGKFYSWRSHELDWDLPWYHNLMDD